MRERKFLERPNSIYILNKISDFYTLCGVCAIDSLRQKFVSGINERTKDEDP